MTKADSKVPYNPGEIDQFLIVDGDGFIYLIPIQRVAGMKGLYVDSYKEYRVGDVSGLIG